MLNLKERQTKSVEIAGEGETKYRFTFARFSAPERQRHIFREEVAKRYVAEEMGVKIEKLYELISKRATGQAVERADIATSDLLLAALAWARIQSSLTMLERFDVQWYPEAIPSEWNTPEGFLSNFESLNEVFELDTVVVALNGDLLGYRAASDEEKKKEDESTKLLEKVSQNSPSQSVDSTKMSRSRQTSRKK